MTLGENNGVRRSKCVPRNTDNGPPLEIELTQMSPQGSELARDNSPVDGQFDGQVLCYDISCSGKKSQSTGIFTRKTAREEQMEALSRIVAMKEEASRNGNSTQSVHVREAHPCKGVHTEVRSFVKPPQDKTPSQDSTQYRPHKVHRRPTSYEPQKSSAPPVWYKSHYCSGRYYNKVLAFDNSCTFDELQDSALRTLAQLTYDRLLLTHLQKAILSVFILRHRVIIVEGGAKTEQKRHNAYNSFKGDRVGKVCSQQGDLLLIPGFFEDSKIQREILSDLNEAMNSVDKVNGTYNTLCDRVADPVNLTERDLDNAIVSASFPVDNVAPINLYLKPVFTNMIYNMIRAKARLAVEVLQTAILVFMNLTEEALYNEDFGAALYLVQLCRKFAQAFMSLISDSDLENTYIFTLTEWYWARCYYNIAHNWSNLVRREKMIARYSETRKDLVCFKSEGFARMFTDIGLEWKDNFPQTLSFSIECCAQAFQKIAIPQSWQLSTSQKSWAVTRNFYNKIMDWVETVTNGGARGNHVDYMMTIRTINREIEQALRQPCTEICRTYRMLLVALSAKCCRFLAAFVDNYSVLFKTDSPSVVTRMPYSYDYGEKRSVRQKAALELLLEIYKNNPITELRNLLIDIGRKTFFDEVIYQIQQQASNPTHTVALTTLASLLPLVMYVWFGEDVPTQPGGLVNAIHPNEKPVFNQMMAMMFYGSAVISCLMYRGSTDKEKEEFLNNAMYYHALAWPCLQRKNVKFEVLNAIFDFLKLEEAGTIEYHVNPLKNGASRCCVLLLRYVTALLPILWKISISHRNDYCPEEVDKNVFIYGMQYPVHNEMLKVGTTPKLSRTNNKILSYLCFDLGLTSPEKNKIVAPRSNPGPGKVCEDFASVVVHQGSSVDSASAKVRPVSKRLPSLYGYCGCPGVEQGCPIESYHNVSECHFIEEETLDSNLVSDVYSNLPRTDVKGDFDHLILDLRRSLSTLLLKTISEFELLRGGNVEEITVSRNGLNPPYRLNLDCVLRSLARAAAYLKFSEPMVLNITRALSMLDETFNNKETCHMLEGRF